MTKIALQYHLGQTVESTVGGCTIRGNVIAFYCASPGKFHYRVRYATTEGAVKVAWFAENELVPEVQELMPPSKDDNPWDYPTSDQFPAITGPQETNHHPQFKVVGDRH